MSKPQKLKNANKKKMSPEAKTTLLNTFKSLYSNQACVDSGKSSPWWIPVIFLCLSILLPLIPIMTSASKIYGAAPLASNNYGSDVGLYETLKTAKANNVEFNINGGLMTFVNVDEETIEKPVAVYYNNASQPNKTISFTLYATEKTGLDFQELLNQINALKYESGTTIPYDSAKEEEYVEKGTTFYTPSFLIFCPVTYGMALYKYNTTTLGTSTYSGLDYINNPQGNLIDYLLDTSSPDVMKNIENTFFNFKVTLNASFTTAKKVSFRNNTLIYFGVYTALILFLGLMVFILTRGKRNVFSYLSFFKCQKIAWMAALTPALLGMLLAFLMSGNILGQMGFVVLVSLRIMWLSMKQLKPIQ